jgi:FkbM family methyltransferase
MRHAELLKRFQSCLDYKQAQPWQKPWLNPSRFARNQLRKRGLGSTTPGALRTVETFHLPEFTIVNGEMVSEEVASYGLFEPALTEAFLRLIQPGQTVVDIGMHLGYYTTLFALLVGPEGQVHAFEPTPSTREIAQRNTSRFSQVVVHPFAVWSSAETITFRDYGPRWMAFNSLTQGKLAEDPVAPQEIQVKTMTLDHFRQGLGRKISLLKIDAESAERAILAGAKQLLASDHPLISVEVGDHDETGDSHLLVKDLIEAGYAPWEFRGGCFVRHEPRQVYDYDNLIFAPASLDLASN